MAALTIFNVYLLHTYLVDMRWDAGGRVPDVSFESRNQPAVNTYDLKGSLVVIFRSTDREEPMLAKYIESMPPGRVRVVCLDKPDCRPGLEKAANDAMLFDSRGKLESGLGHFRTPVVAALGDRGDILCGSAGVWRRNRFESAVQECRLKTAQ
jgi:hypothetical protein